MRRKSKLQVRVRFGRIKQGFCEDQAVLGAEFHHLGFANRFLWMFWSEVMKTSKSPSADRSRSPFLMPPQQRFWAVVQLLPSRNHAPQIDSVGIKAIIRQIAGRSIEATQPVAANGRSVFDRCGYPIQGSGRGIRGVLHREA